MGNGKYYQNDKQQSAMKQNAAMSNHQYNAYIDPDNPVDIVLSVPVNDDEFGHEVEGKVDEHYNGNGNDQGIAQKQAVNKGKNIAVAANLSDDDDDDFASRSKINAQYAQNPKSNQVNKNKKKTNVNI